LTWCRIAADAFYYRTSVPATPAHHVLLSKCVLMNILYTPAELK
jgi:hypothetical protein